MRQFFAAVAVLGLMTLAGCGDSIHWFPDGGGGGGGGGTPSPLPPDFQAQTNVQADTLTTSNSYTVTGLFNNLSTSISVSGNNDRATSKYVINGKGATNANGKIANGDTVTVQHYTANSASSSVSTYLYIGGATLKFQTTTSTLVFPTQYTTSGISQSGPSTVTAEFQTAGLKPVGNVQSISITDSSGEYSLDGTNWYTSQSNLAVGNRIWLRHAASISEKKTTATIVGSTGTYDITFFTRPSQQY